MPADSLLRARRGVKVRIIVPGAHIDSDTVRRASRRDGAALNNFDAAFARQQTAIFKADLARSRPISLAHWQQRPWRQMRSEELASLLGPQL